MKKLLLLAIPFVVMVSSLQTLAQERPKPPKKGSYLEFGQPALEDNSMFIEEAFNQESGIIQHISNLIIDNGNVVYSYTAEIPLADVKHQFSCGITYNSFKKPDFSGQQFSKEYLTKGLGDVYLNYRPLLSDKNDWLLVIPRFTVILPTGDARYGFGGGGVGGQFNLAVTKRVSRGIVTHYNVGHTVISKSKYYTFNTEGDLKLDSRKDLNFTNLGASTIWFLTSKFNVLTEIVATFQEEFLDQGRIGRSCAQVINPGFRFAVDIGKIQIVPGAGIPVNFIDGKFQNSAVFFYLSFEPE